MSILQDFLKKLNKINLGLKKSSNCYPNYTWNMGPNGHCLLKIFQIGKTTIYEDRKIQSKIDFIVV